MMTKSEELRQPKSYPTGLVLDNANARGVPGQAQLNAKRKAVAKTKRRIEITVEQHRLVVLSRRNRSINTWCETCGEQVQMVTPDQAAQLWNVSTRTIYRRVEAGRLHFMETEKGLTLICFQSLENNSKTTQAWEEHAVTRPSGNGRSSSSKARGATGWRPGRSSARSSKPSS